MENPVIEQLQWILKIKGHVAQEMLNSPWSERDRQYGRGMQSVLKEIQKILDKNGDQV